MTLQDLVEKLKAEGFKQAKMQKGYGYENVLRLYYQHKEEGQDTVTLYVTVSDVSDSQHHEHRYYAYFYCYRTYYTSSRRGTRKANFFTILDPRNDNAKDYAFETDVLDDAVLGRLYATAQDAVEIAKRGTIWKQEDLSLENLAAQERIHALIDQVCS